MILRLHDELKVNQCFYSFPFGFVNMSYELVLELLDSKM